MTVSESDRPSTVHWLGLLGFLFICLSIGGLGALATTPEIDGWYQTVPKPSWNPPANVFGPVWMTLYLMMATAGWLIWKQERFQSARVPLTLFAIQLGLNLAWSWVFFRFHLIGWAVIEIVILWFAILATIITFFRRSKLAASLLVPYLLWVSFAVILNFTIWRLASAK